MTFTTRRRTERPPRLVGRTFAEIAQELQEFLEKDHERAEGGIPGGHNGTTPGSLVVGGAGSPGSESAGWMAADAIPPVPVGNPIAIAIANSAGSSGLFNHSDHIHAAVITANGDILTVNAAASALIAHAVGIYPQVLKADPGSATGLAWEHDFVWHAVLDLADTVAEDAVTVTLPAAGFASIAIHWSVFASDGTDHQIRSGITYVNAVNKAGAFTTNLAQENKVVSLSAGTLAVTWSLVAANPLQIQVAADTSLTPTILQCRYRVEDELDDQTITLVGV